MSSDKILTKIEGKENVSGGGDWLVDIFTVEELTEDSRKLRQLLRELYPNAGRTDPVGSGNKDRE